MIFAEGDGGHQVWTPPHPPGKPQVAIGVLRSNGMGHLDFGPTTYELANN